MFNEDDLNSKENREAFDRLIAKAVLAGKPLDEYLHELPLSDEEKKAILEYRKKLEEKKEENTGVGAMKIPSSRAPVSPAIWFLLVVVIVFAIGTGISDYYKNQRQEKIASEEKAKQEMELNRFKKELEEKLNSPEQQTLPPASRGLLNIFEYEAWRKGGKEGLREYDQEMQRKKLDEINRKLDNLEFDRIRRQ